MEGKITESTNSMKSSVKTNGVEGTYDDLFPEFPSKPSFKSQCTVTKSIPVKSVTKSTPPTSSFEEIPEGYKLKVKMPGPGVVYPTAYTQCQQVLQEVQVRLISSGEQCAEVRCVLSVHLTFQNT